MSYKVRRYRSAALATSATTIIHPSIDVSEFDKFFLQIENCQAAATVVHVLVEASAHPSDSAAAQAPTWFPISTATYLYASAIAASAVIATTMWDNAYQYIRVSVRTTVSMSEGFLPLTIGGFTRFHD